MLGKHSAPANLISRVFPQPRVMVIVRSAATRSAPSLEWQYAGNKLHPTQKPLGSLKPLIEAFCSAGGLVFDPFCGSGSILVAAWETGRSFIGIELAMKACSFPITRPP